MTRSLPSRPEKAVALLRDLASTPRPTGSDAIASARQRVAHELREIGFDVRELPFDYSAFPGRFATPLSGGAIALLVGAAGHAGAGGARYLPLALLAPGLVMLAAAMRWLTRRGVLRTPLLRARGMNLEARRGGATPRVWLCAHLDSKSQPVPSLVRMTGITTAVIGTLATLVLALLAAAGRPTGYEAWAAAAVVTLAGALPVLLSVVGQNSPGALDNASGVATVIDAARRLGARGAVGVLITDAEELGLAGAHAWSADHHGAVVVLNCDGVDDAGDNIVMHAGAKPSALVAAAERGARSLGMPITSRRMPPGLLTDSVAFAQAGHRSATFSRGSWGSLARVHSRRDDLSRLAGTGIAPVAALMAATVREIIEGS